MKTKLLGVVGSLNAESLSRHAVRYLLDQAQAGGAEVRMLDLREHPLPMFNPDDRTGKEVDHAREEVKWANAFLLGSPDYHGSMSGAMKNFLDYFWKEFSGKLFGYVCASHEKGLTTMDQMRTAVRQCYGWSMPYGASVTNGDFDATTGKIVGEKTQRRLDLLVYDLLAYAPLLWKQFESDVQGGNPGAGFAVHHHVKK